MQQLQCPVDGMEIPGSSQGRKMALCILFFFLEGFKLGFQPHNRDRSVKILAGALVPALITALFGSVEMLCYTLIPLIGGTYSRVLTAQAHTLILLCGLELISTDDTCTLIPLSLL